MHHLSFVAFVTLATAAAVPHVKRQFTSTTENQFTDAGTCNDITVLFARGTTEAGNVGSLTGPPFFQALSTAVGADKLTVQGVDYAADIPGFLEGGDPQGSSELASLIGQAGELIYTPLGELC